MDTRSCAHHTCDNEFTSKYPTKRYCSKHCRENAKKRRQYVKNPDRFKAKRQRWLSKDGNQDYPQKYRDANRENLREYSREYRKNNPEYRERERKRLKRHYETVTVPRGQRMQQRLWNLFQAQGLKDPSGLPELARRVLEWKPRGFTQAVQYAKNPYGPLEYDWLWYAELNAEEAVVAYAG